MPSCTVAKSVASQGRKAARAALVEKSGEEPTDEEINEAYENDPTFYNNLAGKSRGEWCHGLAAFSGLHHSSAFSLQQDSHLS